ncbi:MAG: hypothetical protein ACQUHE_13700 [Bacteroidia bacterium]
MKKRGLYKLVAFVLLFAVQLAILPFYQIFHKHHTAKTTKHGQTVVQKYEKPCCHGFEVTLEADLQASFTFSFEQAVAATYSDYSNPEFSNQFFNLTNKAPPVEQA